MDTPTPSDVARFDDVSDAVAGSDLVLSPTSSKVAVEAAASAAPHLSTGTTYADMNSASAAVKNDVATAVSATDGIAFADVVGTVPVHGARTALVVSGSGRAQRPSTSARLGHRSRTSVVRPVTRHDGSCCLAASWRARRADRRVHRRWCGGGCRAVGTRPDRRRTVGWFSVPSIDAMNAPQARRIGRRRQARHR
ncbi:hypothetical protein [Rhodococcus sp. IEGM1428]|uniref:hypothetical protein n=1 Tax=Rhodococcus sp. IEGM1428 TaxID=3392191 RepID=UPI003D0D5F6F